MKNTKKVFLAWWREKYTKVDIFLLNSKSACGGCKHLCKSCMNLYGLHEKFTITKLCFKTFEDDRTQITQIRRSWVYFTHIDLSEICNKIHLGIVHV